MSILHAHTPSQDHPWRDTPFGKKAKRSFNTKDKEFAVAYFKKEAPLPDVMDFFDSRLDNEEYITVNGHTMQIDHLVGDPVW